MKEKNVSVIVCSYNRSHVLEETIPTYIQDITLEVIVVDDGSSDATREKVRELHNKYKEVKYIRLKENKGLPYARNVGISRAKGEYIFFGDDDAVLYDDTLHQLRNAIENYPADIAGANGSYATDIKQIRNLEQYIKTHFKREFDTNCMLNFNTGICTFDYKFDKVKEGLYIMSSFLIKAEYAKDTKFDVGYIGTAAKEDTDYLVRQAKKGRKMVYVPDTYEIDLPRSYVGGGGCHTMKLWRSYMYNLRNDLYFINRHYDYLKEHGYLSISKRKHKLMTLGKYIRLSQKLFCKEWFGF